LIGISGALAFQQAVPLQFSQVIAELIQSVGGGGKLEGGEHRLVDLLGGPAADGVAAVQQDLQQANDSGVVDFDAGITHRADGDRQGQTLQQCKVHVDIEALRLETGKTIGDGLKPLSHRVEVIETFFRPKSRRLLEQSSLRRKRENFSYCLRKAFFQ
jgi:hypothetical protein